MIAACTRLTDGFARLPLACTAVFAFFASPTSAWAQAQPEAKGHSDVMAYMLVVFCVALGMILVCRSANRTPEVKLEELEEE